jgi:hypothetical protein
MESFIAAGLFRLRMQAFSKKKDANLLKANFTDWLTYVVLAKKKKNVLKKIKKIWVNEFWQLLRKN